MQSANFEEINCQDIKTEALADRPSRVSIEDFAKLSPPEADILAFIESLPDILAGADIKRVIAAIVAAHHQQLPVIFCYGAHVVKVGLSPVIIQLIRQGILTLVATNGAGSIHDVEIALSGKTSEDVGAGIKEGCFGMVRETSEFVNRATTEAYEQQIGLGAAMGRNIAARAGPYIELSILAAAHQQGIAATVHVAPGTDINHMHPSAQGEAIGAATMRDFRIFAAQVAKLQGGGVILLAGSAVILPLIIEKSLALARNLDYPVGGFTGVNLDFIRHYRPSLNPVARAEELGGEGISIIGHHEINLPLIAAAVLEQTG